MTNGLRPRMKSKRDPRAKRALRELDDNLKSGLHDHAPSCVYDTVRLTRGRAKRQKHVLRCQWGDECSGDQPIHFCGNESKSTMDEITIFCKVMSVWVGRKEVWSLSYCMGEGGIER